MRYSGVLITGSPAMVTDRAPWSERLLAHLRCRLGRGSRFWVFVMGISCSPMPLGGEVDYQAGGRNQFLPDAGGGFRSPCLERFRRFLRTPDPFPKCCKTPGWSNLACIQQSGQVQAVHFSRMLGVQFHPEFDRSHHGSIFECVQRDYSRFST